MSEFLNTAVDAALLAGKLLRENFDQPLEVDEMQAHDIKLELDRRTQRLIEDHILARHPDHAILGEEGIREGTGECEWIIDPLDGTVNYFYGIPHFATTIAVRRNNELLAGVIHDPMRDETWTVEAGGPALLNGRKIEVSRRTNLQDCIISMGVSKTVGSINGTLPAFNHAIRRVKKMRMLGSAALDIAYVATGRLDAYLEGTISLWDIAAGLLLVPAAGGVVDLRAHPDNPNRFRITATSGRADFASLLPNEPALPTAH
ncbi:MAG: inositol monophosphatase family protein [Verrucomicrobia bacterium]|jgi:myo-inositol-1(or 4)-monophosphatase|nr:inositol monophosphatase family protein [Verrucomicrobiota bacterium]MDA1203573.1 inositol monophosphatase family protein [Verrucomicrobiota bacterium]